MPPKGVAGRATLDRFELHKRFKHRLRRTPGIVETSSRPSSMRPVEVVATVDTGAFLDRPHSPARADLGIEWRPRPDRDAFYVQYSEDDTPWSCGWHQDRDHEELGPNHFQVDHRDWETPYRTETGFEDPNPMAILDTCLDVLRRRVPDLPGSVAPG